MSAVCCFLPAVCCLLSAVCCLLSTVYCLLYNCLLSVLCCLLSAVLRKRNNFVLATEWVSDRAGSWDVIASKKNRKWSPLDCCPTETLQLCSRLRVFTISVQYCDLFCRQPAFCFSLLCRVYNTVAGKVKRRVKEIHVLGFDSGLFGETKYEGVISWYPGMKYWNFFCSIL